MKHKNDFRQILEHPVLYTLYQKLVGGYKARRLFIENDVNIKSNDEILDIGCGPGYILDFLPEVNYTGIDLDKNYIEKAIDNYGDRGSFICTSIDNFEANNNNRYDRIITSGVLHHLTDKQCNTLFTKAKQLLKTNGRFVSMDGCYIPNQNKIAKYLLDKDRGEYVRSTEEYLSLATSIFDNVSHKINNSYFNIPYTSIILNCH